MFPAVIYWDYKWLRGAPMGPAALRDSTNKISGVASYLSVGEYVKFG